ncbi:RloB family protein [uncultured Leuconostoc sp.]|uniref:RloB family protein n=1 Tax=uncultured Leuconostoc sp. TaxID=173262 RepID=UPI0028058566|nr:RloB family protein [uncultured Leuconostoc sp.]
MSKQGRINKRKTLTKMLGDSANRSEDSLNTIKTFLIITEGVQTEVNYFKSFPLYAASVITVIGTGFNTLSLVERANVIKQSYNAKQVEFDEAWLVFDKDSFPDQDFDNAVMSARSNGFQVAYSNESFELWFLLHYEYLTSQISREQCITSLTKHLGSDYKKNSTEMYNILLPFQKTALLNAHNLKKFQEGKVSHDQQPVTYVVDLVENLNMNSRNRFE